MAFENVIFSRCSFSGFCTNCTGRHATLRSSNRRSLISALPSCVHEKHLRFRCTINCEVSPLKVVSVGNAISADGVVSEEFVIIELGGNISSTSVFSIKFPMWNFPLLRFSAGPPWYLFAM